MKYQVQIKFTNPSHEHVSLRRRVDTITRIVEAANEAEAINRAANQQRALGFLIKEAEVYAPVNGLHSLALNNNEPQKGKEKKKKLVGDDNEVTDVGASKGVKEAAGGIDSYPLLKKGEKLKPMKLKEDEEVELDEAQKKLRPSYWKAEWRLGTQSEVDKNNKKIFDKLAKTDPVKASAFHDNLMRMKKKDVKEEVEQIDERNMENKAKKNAMATKLGVSTYVYGKGVGVNKYDHEPSFKADPAGFKKVGRSVMQSPKTTSSQVTALKKANEEAVTEASKEGKDVMRNMRASLKSMDLRHGVDSDKREAGYKMSPAVKAAQAKSDALSKTVKRPQAGTLAAAKMKKEAAENNGKQKARKAAEKMVNRAKSKANKIDVEPSIEPGKPNT